MVIRTFGKDFNSWGGALTLRVREVSTDEDVQGGVHERTHEDGWTIRGQVHEDYYTWVNDFEAKHPTLGRVWGNFEQEVRATSKAAFNDFYAKHKPQEWDYADI